MIEGYLGEHDLDVVQPGSEGRFVADTGKRCHYDCVVRSIAPAGTRYLDDPLLASVFGGPVPVAAGHDGDRLLTLKTVYRIRFMADRPVAADRVVRGRVLLAGQPRSFAVRAWRRISAVLVRESGF